MKKINLPGGTPTPSYAILPENQHLFVCTLLAALGAFISSPWKQSFSSPGKWVWIFLLFMAGWGGISAQTCNCTEYIYLNEPNAQSVLKFEVGAGILLTEVVGANGGTPPAQHWYPGLGVSQMPNPHGLATDLNGNLYIGSRSNPNNPIRQFTCDGVISPVSPTTITPTDVTANMFSIGNTLYKNGNGGIRAYDICTGELLGSKCLRFAGSFWGLSYNEATGMVYASEGDGDVWSLPVAELNDFTTCTERLLFRGPNATVNVGENFTPSTPTGSIWGVVGDNVGNVYVVKGLNASSTAIYKYNSAGQFITKSIESTDAGAAFGNGIGITWSEGTNRLYMANLTDAPEIDCISAFDASTMAYLGTAAPNPNLPANNSGKAIAILKECCPVNLPSTFTKNLCEASIGQKFYLNQEAFDTCDGIVCGSSWTPTSVNGMTFDDCDNSVTITSPTGCSTFTLNIGAVSSTGCGAQSSTFTICNSTPPVVTATAGSCDPATNEYILTGQVTISVPPASGTMTVSVSGGGSEVFNAPFAGTTPFSITGLNSGGATRTVTVTFSEAASCEATTTYTEPSACMVSCNCTEYIYLNEPDLPGILKFEVNSSSVGLTEVAGANGLPHWYPGTGVSELPSPHGLGTDLNGRLYIGENAANGNIRQFDCDGVLAPIGPTTIFNPGVQQNSFSIGNILFVNTHGGPTAYNTCTGASVGQVCLNDADGNPMPLTGPNLWGLSYNPVTEMIYATSRTIPAQPTAWRNLVWAFSRVQLEAALASGNCIDPFIVMGGSNTVSPGDNFIPQTMGPIMGITSDNAGNMYIVKSVNATGAANLPAAIAEGTYIFKYNSLGNFVGQTPVGFQGDAYHGGIGIVWSETTNRLYMSNLTDAATTDCISAFDANTMTYVGTAAPNPNLPTNNTAKAIAILKECCPINTPSAFTKNVCGIVGEQFFLNEEAFNTCDGIVCGSSWTATSLNGMTFDDCDNSVTITGSSGCSTFTLYIGAVSSTGCGAQSSTFTICNSAPPVVTATAGNCAPATNEYTLTGQVTISAPPASGTMTVSVSGGGSQVFIAPFAGTSLFTITGLNSGGATRTVTVTFSEAASCSATTTYNEPAACAPEGSCNCTEYIYLNEPDLPGVLKFEVNSSSVGLTEVAGANGLPHWYPGTGVSELPSPHGLGTDLNGRLYIGENGENGNIRQFDCDGVLAPIVPTTIFNPGVQQNSFSIGNILFVNTHGGPTAYNTCTGASTGQVCLNDADGNPMPLTGPNLWGLSYNPVTEMIYATSRTSPAQPTAWRNLVWAFSRTQLESALASGDCIDPFITLGSSSTVNPGDNFTPQTIGPMMGVTSDNDGNIYIIKSILAGGGNLPGALAEGTYILKYNSLGNFVGQTPASFQNEAYHGGIGIVWSETTNRLYMSNFANNPATDCISAFDASSMTYVGTAAPNPNLPVASQGKAIAILKECCPVNTPSVFTKNVCGGTGQKFYLNEEAFNTCDGIVCGSSWVPTSVNGMTFDDCDNSVTITGSSGCSTFTLDIGAVSSTGCAAQSSTFTICNSAPPVVTANVTCTSVTEYTVSGTVTIDNPPATGTLTIMDSQGGSQVINAPFVSPIPYSIAGLTKDGIAHTVTVVFSEATTCTTLTNYSAPQAEIVEAGDPATICRTRNVVLSSLGASVSPSGLAATWSSSGDGTFTGGTAFGTATEYVPGAMDILMGSVTLMLTSNTVGSPCPVATDAVLITILNVDCGSFPWNGN